MTTEFKAAIYQLTDGSLRKVVSFYPLQVHDLKAFAIDYNTKETVVVDPGTLKLLKIKALFYEEAPFTFNDLKKRVYQHWAQLNAMVLEIIMRDIQPVKPLHKHKNLHSSDDAGGSPSS